MKDEYYDKCIACYNTDIQLFKCSRCVYKICKACIIDLSTVKINLCKDIECRYDYLDDIEECHCYVCDKNKDKDTIEFKCPTCALNRDCNLNTFDNEIKEKIRKKGIQKFKSKEHDLAGFFIAFFTILDLDTGEIELLSFREGPNTIII